MSEELVGTGRHLTPTELRLWTSLLDASRILDTELEAQLVNEFGMTHREYEVLVRIDGAGGRQRLTVLARQIEASPALVTQTVDRLEQRGWLKRAPAADDRRGVEAVLTSVGRSELAAAAGPHAELVRKLLIDPMKQSQHAPVADGLGRAADHLRSHRAGTGCDDADCPIA